MILGKRITPKQQNDPGIAIQVDFIVKVDKVIEVIYCQQTN